MRALLEMIAPMAGGGDRPFFFFVRAHGKFKISTPNKPQAGHFPMSFGMSEGKNGTKWAVLPTD
jgi:hypothetical protein